MNVTSREMGDDLGSFQYIKIFWKGDSINFITGFKIYEEEPIIIFEQRFPDGGNFTQLGDSLETLDQVISAFPRFQLQGGRISELGYFTFRYFWDLDMIGVGLDQMPGGLYAGVPLVLYDLNTLRSIVLSPLQNFKTGFQSRPDFFQNDLVCGLHGRIRSIPADFSHQTILFAGSGINSLLESWGDLMLQRYGKQRRKPGTDFISSYLGYFTDTGGYYWYNTEPNKNYQTTIVDVLNYHKSIQLPIRYYELDSWWYYKGNNSVGESGGIKLWEPRPDIFPDGMDGIQSILNTPLVTHSKYYSPDNEYKKKFPFMIEEQAAIPLTGDFWNFIMSQAASWGVTTWEQDWLASIFELMVQPSWVNLFK